MSNDLDDGYDPFDDVPAKDEPDCFACFDRGTVGPGFVSRLVGRRWMRCPSCNPTRLTILYWRSGLWRLRGLLRRRLVEYSDEPPF